MHVPEIIEVKNLLDSLKAEGLIETWELPYENLLTRRSAAIFFLTPTDEGRLKEVVGHLEKFENFNYRSNDEQLLSALKYRITFSEEEKEKSVQLQRNEEKQG